MLPFISVHQYWLYLKTVTGCGIVLTPSCFTNGAWYWADLQLSICYNYYCILKCNSHYPYNNKLFWKGGMVEWLFFFTAGIRTWMSIYNYFKYQKNIWLSVKTEMWKDSILGDRWIRTSQVRILVESNQWNKVLFFSFLSHATSIIWTGQGPLSSVSW